MRPHHRILPALLACALSGALSLRSTADTTDNAFLVKPYVQLGDSPALAAKESLLVLWQTEDKDAEWAVETKTGGDWVKADTPTMRRVAVKTIEPHRLYTAKLTGLTPGADIAYRVLKGGASVFKATARARKPKDAPYRFVVFGDCAAGTDGQKAIAYQTHQLKPDFVLITGDIVYSAGRISEYRDKFFPVYNADEAAPATGAPLIRSTLFLAAPGNHDILNRNLEKFPDLLAYYLYWSQPLNGPLTTVGAANSPTLEGPEEHQKAFLSAAGATYPRMANFSFDYGNAHWTVLDADPYADWTNPELRAWVEKDLKSARKATWRFVAFHHPGFNSSKAHFEYQRMRVLADVFEKGGVDIVFSGHVHNYQRSFPLRFVVRKNAEGKVYGAKGEVEGEWTLDKTFDGKTHTRMNGVLYLITGGGGAKLYDPQQQGDPASWQAFTVKFISDTHSLTAVDVNGKSLTVRQISEDGKERDRFSVTK